MTELLAPIEQCRPMRTPGPITAHGADHRAAPDLRARSEHRAGINHHAVLERAVGCTKRPADTSRASNNEEGRIASG